MLSTCCQKASHDQCANQNCHAAYRCDMARLAKISLDHTSRSKLKLCSSPAASSHVTAQQRQLWSLPFIHHFKLMPVPSWRVTM